MRRLSLFLIAAAIALLMGATPASAQNARLNGLGRFDGWRENALIGYGIVVGLAGSGDSPRSAVTRQALRNVYGRLGAVVSDQDINSRNVAVVVVVANLPPSANLGDRISATVSSTADARSLAGGTLLMTPLMGPDGQTYALAQGAVIAGGDSFESQLNLRQRNYPTAARLEGGATVERPVHANLIREDGRLGFLLYEPNFTTAARIAEAINSRFGQPLAQVIGADEVRIDFRAAGGELASFVSAIENIAVEPDRAPRIVINERTGTVVAGGDVTISSVVISQGDIRVTVTEDTFASQPGFIGGRNDGIRSLIITNTTLDVERGQNDVVARFPNTTVADLVQGLSRARVDTRRMISILQAIKAAGALHGDIIVQ
jgi:flagellar P-ring protein precursor FlgI